MQTETKIAGTHYFLSKNLRPGLVSRPLFVFIVSSAAQTLPQAARRYMNLIWRWLFLPSLRLRLAARLTWRSHHGFHGEGCCSRTQFCSCIQTSVWVCVCALCKRRYRNAKDVECLTLHMYSSVPPCVLAAMQLYESQVEAAWWPKARRRCVWANLTAESDTAVTWT